MTLIANTYCTLADLERRYSEDAVISWSDHDQDGIADTGVIDDAINQASEEIAAYALQKYSQIGLAGSTLINRWCTAVAGYFACISRGNPPPDSMLAEYNRIMAHLEQIVAGTYQLPGVALRFDSRPTMSNLRIDRRYVQPKIRVQQETSTNSPSVLSQNLDGATPRTP